MQIHADSRRRIPVEQLNRELIAPVLRDLQTVHHLQGAFIPGSPALLVVRVPRPDMTLKQLSYHLCKGFFGASAVLVADFSDGSATIVCVPAGLEGFDTLAAERIHIATVIGKKILDAWEVSKAPFAQVCEDVTPYEPDMPDSAAHYWEVISVLHNDDILRLSANDHLSVGWVLRYQCEMERISEYLAKLRAIRTSILPPASAHSFIRLVLQEDFHLAQLMQCLVSEVGGDFTKWCDIHRQWNIEGALDFPVELWKSYLLSPKLTGFGKRVPWVNSTNWQVEFSQVEVDDFPPGFQPEDYWPRLSLGSIDWGKYVTGHDIYVSLDLMENGWGDFAGADNVEKTNKCIDSLYAEAVANKRGTIPHKAIVELSFGPFTHVELTEKGSSVTAVLRTVADEFYDIVVAPRDGCSSFRLPETVPSSRRQAITAGVDLLMAAVIRDFWVVEEREMIFERRATVSSRVPQRPASDNPRVVYLPRTRYHERPDVGRCVSNLGHTERRLHAVVPHIRRLAAGCQASDHQRTLAKLYGFHCEEGYTFVGPHQRGRENREVMYRSRSALKSLYVVGAENTTDTKPDRWFQFERDVHKLMVAMGFTVEHVAASRHGDNGIDIYATKGRDLDQINWVVQCKCWYPRRKISPNVIRELVGVLVGYPHGTRGMVVTTCGFSAGAIEAAKAANIRLIDGVEFLELTQPASGQESPAPRHNGKD